MSLIYYAVVIIGAAKIAGFIVFKLLPLIDR